MIMLNVIGSLLLLVITISLMLMLVNHVIAKFEKRAIAPPGKIVNICGFSFHVYSVGPKTNIYSIILMSGSGEPAPIYNYKTLYTELAENNHIVVLEKFGYGYSDVSGLARDIRTLVEQDRESLRKANELPPYILMPHSMSALESLYWANKYPNEVLGIIGLDMALPKSYFDKNNYVNIIVKKVFTLMGFHRIRFIYRLFERGLSKDEIKQQRLIVHTKTLNKDVMNECKSVYKNARLVNELGIPHIPILQFSSNMSPQWERVQNEYSEGSSIIDYIPLSCGHYIHYLRYCQ